MGRLSAQDINRTIPALSANNVQAQGTFVFYKSGLTRVKVTINNESVVMEPGDVRRTTEPFDSFEVENLSGAAQAVELVTGFGDYNRIIVRGEISALAQIIDSSGLPRPDTRTEIEMQMGFSPSTGFNRVVGDFREVHSVEPAAGAGVTSAALTKGGIVNGQRSYYVDDYDKIYVTDADSGELIEEAVISGFRPDYIYHPDFGQVVLDQGTSPDQWLAYDGVTPGSKISDALANNMKNDVCFLIGGEYVTADPANSADLLVASSITDTNPVKIEGVVSYKGTDRFFPHPSNPDIVRYRQSTTKVAEINIRTGVVSQLDIDLSGPLNIQYNFSYPEFYEARYSGGQVDRWAAESNEFWGRGINRQVTALTGVIQSPRFEFVKNDGTLAQSYDDKTRTWIVDAIFQAISGYRAEHGLGGVPENYLDYVHAVSVNGVEVINTGYRSLAADKKTDNLTIKNPSIVKVTVATEAIT